MENDSAGKRAADYWFIDGIPELVYGAAIGLWSIAGFVWKVYFHATDAMMIILMIAGTALLLAMILWDRRIIEPIKARITYPRTGYVQAPAIVDSNPNPLITLNLNPLEQPRNENVTLFRSQVVLLMQTFFLSFNLRSRWSPALVTSFVALLFLIFRRRPYYRFSTISLIVLALMGVGIAIANPPEPGRRFLASACSGIWLAGIGLIKLIRYLRANPLLRPPASEVHA